MGTQYMAGSNVATEMEISFSSYKRKCMTVAKDFFYPSEVLEKIENAKTIPELERIMTTARQKL